MSKQTEQPQLLDSWHIVESIGVDSETETMLAERRSDKQAFLLRRLREDAKRSDYALQHEYEMVSQYRLQCMLPLAGKDGSGGDTVILYQPVGGTLGERIVHPDMTQVLAMADSVAKAINESHEAGMVLLNLTPATVLIGSQQAWIINFTRAMLHDREHPDFGSPWLIPGDLRYIAPEQTGRMNCPVDYRADYYAFGALLYQWLTGRPPFVYDDPLDLIYAHLAEAPLPPDRLNAEVPPFLAAVVLKLLAKAPEQRYQSMDGLRADLQQLKTSTPDSYHRPGRFDAPLQILVSHKLYGREHERQCLLDSYQRVCQGHREMVLIAGYSGIGKTALIRETYIPITYRKAMFVAGKFDLLQRSLPYSAWIDALRKLIDFVMSEPESSLEQWRSTLADALGRDAAVLANVIPGLGDLLGAQAQAPVAELPPSEAMNRFNQTFRRFIGVFCLPDRPLVIFLDDLQWIDSASLNLLELLAKDDTLTHLLLIGAYRDNEVPAAHPLALALTELKQDTGFKVQEIALKPLADSAIMQLLADTFSTLPADVAELCAVISHKTAGNPFFLWQFLRTLHAQKLITLDVAALRWGWDIDAMRQVGFADNVLDLMLHRFAGLPRQTQTTLALAACLGTRFSLDRLAQLLAVPVAEAYDALLPALNDEFILPDSAPEMQGSRLVTRELRFLHDRVQEAAYRSMPETVAEDTHYRIARLLLEATPADQLPEHIFDIADQLNRALPLLQSRAEGLELARLNLLAAQKAKLSAAYSAALSYLQLGMTRLPDDVWLSEHELAFALFRERGELEYLNANFDQARDFIEQAIGHEPDKLRQAALFHMLVVQYTLRALYPKAIDVAREGLRLFDVELPTANYETVRDRELAQLWQRLGDRPLSMLGELPPMQDAEQQAIMLLLTGMGPPCYRSHPRLWGVIVAREINMILQYGCVPSATYSFPAFGGLLTHVGQGDAEHGRQLYQATCALMRRFASPTDDSVGHLMIGSSLRHWFAPLSEASRDYLNAYKAGLDSGNLQYAVYGFGHNTYCRFFQGVALSELIQETLGYRAFSLQRKNLWGIDLTEGALRVFTALQNGDGQTDFSWQGEPEALYLQRCEEHSNLQVLCIYYILKTEALLHLAQTEAAAVSLLEAERRLDSVSTQGLLLTYQFYRQRAQLLFDAPALLGCSAAQAHEDINAIRARFNHWAKGCPANFDYAVWLLDAEAARLEGDWPTAAERYDRALDSVAAQGFLHRQAFIAQRAADFWEGRGKSAFAGTYREQAYKHYEAWQAQAVILAVPGLSAFRRSKTVDQIAWLREQDIQDVIRIGQLIFSHTVLNDVVQEVVAHVERMSGAQRVVLIMLEAGRFSVVADTQTQVTTTAPVDLAASLQLPQSLIQYTARMNRPVAVTPEDDSPLVNDSYLREHGVRSALCLPLSNLGQPIAVLYLEHKTLANAFAADAVPLMELVAAQAAVSLTNASLYANLREEINLREIKEAELRRSNADLKRLGEVMAHHFQEPARRLVGFAGHLQKKADLVADTDSRQALDFIYAQANRLSGLVRDAQRYLALGATPAADVKLDSEAVIRRVLAAADIATLAPDTDIKIQTPLQQVSMPTHYLREIFAILLDNALRYRRTDRPLRLDISATITGARVCFRFADNGSGIAPEYRERVFGIFIRLVPNRPHYPGNGMGLAVLRKIVHQAGGAVHIEDGLDGGVCFVFDLPSTM